MICYPMQFIVIMPRSVHKLFLPTCSNCAGYPTITTTTPPKYSQMYVSWLNRLSILCNILVLTIVNSSTVTNYNFLSCFYCIRCSVLPSNGSCLPLTVIPNDALQEWIFYPLMAVATFLEWSNIKKKVVIEIMFIFQWRNNRIHYMRLYHSSFSNQ